MMRKRFENDSYGSVLFVFNILKGLPSLVGNFKQRDSFIIRVRLPDNKTVSFQPFCDACDIGPWNEHDSAHPAHVVPPLIRSFEDSKDIIFLKRQSVAPKNGRMGSFEILCCSHNAQQYFLGET